jgi:hypothetical protein
MSFSLCSTTTENTGSILCDVSRGVLNRLFIFNGSIAAADYGDSDDLLAKMVEYSKLSKTATNKIFPLPEAQEIADSSEANKEGSLGLGFKTILLEGKPAYTVKAFAGSTLVKAMRRFNNQTVRLLEYDENGRLWGTVSGTDFVGFQAKIFVTGGKIATGQNVEEGVATITVSFLSTSEYFDAAYYKEITGSIDDVAGLQPVELSEFSSASNVSKIAITVPTSEIGGSINVYDTFSSELAVGSLWNARTGTNYATTLTITGVAVDATNSVWSVTFDSTAFTALGSGDTIKVYLDSPDLLDAADVTGIEGDYCIITKP